MTPGTNSLMEPLHGGDVDDGGRGLEDVHAYRHGGRRVRGSTDRAIAGR
jgi:hypothetical protein